MDERAGGQIRRPRLEARLDDSASARLTVVTAGAGYGKTSLLRAWSGGRPTAWHTVTSADRTAGAMALHLVDALRLVVPDLSADLVVASTRVRGPDTDHGAQVEASAAALADAVDATLRRRTVLILDDLDEIRSSDEATTLVSAFIRQAPQRLHIVLAGRDRPPFGVARLVAHGDAVEIDAAELAFTPDELSELSQTVLAGTDVAALAAVQRAAGGWPVAARLALEAIALAPASDRQDVIDGLAEPHGVLLDYITEEVIGRDQPGVLSFLSYAEPLAVIDAGLAQAVGIPDAEAMLQQVISRGVYVIPVARGSSRVSMAPMFRAYVARHHPLSTQERRDVLTAAARWHEAAGEAAQALDYWIRLGAHTACRRMLASYGDELAAAGQAQIVVDAAALIPADDMSPVLETIVGDAHTLLGDWEAALMAYRRSSERPNQVPARIAWRTGLLHYTRGDLDAAVEAYQSAAVDDPEPAARALVLGWHATVRWIRGDVDGCRQQVAEALAAARESGDDRALACAHTVLAMLAALDGDREANDAHYLRALDHASAARDIFQLVRIHSNRASLHLEMGDFEGTLVEVDLALKLADLAGLAFPRGVALSNRGRALIGLGRLDEARAELEASRQVFERLASPMASYPYVALGDLHRLRGDRMASQAAYTRACELAEKVADTQGLVPALAGLSRLLAEDEPERAREVAARAIAAGASLGRVEALLAYALTAAQPQQRAERAEQAALAAQVQRDRAGLAEAWEVTAAARGDAGLMRKAIALWRELGNPIGVARAEIGLAELDHSPHTVTQAHRAMRHAAALGALSLANRADTAPEVSVRCLGGFVVLRNGEPVTAGAWQSRKARELLKILICRRGRALHREQLGEILWPNDDPGKITNRLSVALSTVRTVLDPGHSRPADHFIGADGDAVVLRLAHLEVDVERFLAGATAALASARHGDDEALATLAEAESLYTGDLFDDDPYLDWSVDLREKARLTYLDVARRLAGLVAQSGDHDAQARYLLRILERDQYDEAAHLDLVALLARDGRHGEARRRYRLYSRQMEQIGVEAAPYPATAAGARAAL